LWAHKQKSSGSCFQDAQPTVIREINRRTAHNAYRFVFSSRHEVWIMPFALKGTSHSLNRLTI
jgi:hypothetical protein